MHTFSVYYRGFFRTFLKAAVHSWREEVAMLIIVPALTYLVKGRDVTSKADLKTALISAGIVFVGLAVYHWIRTPWLLQTYQDTSLAGRALVLSPDLKKFLNEKGPNPMDAKQLADMTTAERIDLISEVSMPWANSLHSGYAAHLRIKWT